MRDARAYRVPPSRYLGLPWPEWGDTDRTLAHAVAEHDRRLCGCGCGQWADQAHDPESLWTVEHAVCSASAAMQELRDEWGDDLPPGSLLRVTYAGRSVSARPDVPPGPVWTVMDGAPEHATTDNDNNYIE